MSDLIANHDPTVSCAIEGTQTCAPSPVASAPLSARASRREFIKGVIASGVAVSSAGYVVVGRGGDARAQAAGAVERLVMLNVNGRDRPVDVLPNETLIRTLR